MLLLMDHVLHVWIEIVLHIVHHQTSFTLSDELWGEREGGLTYWLLAEGTQLTLVMEVEWRNLEPLLRADCSFTTTCLM